MVYSQNVDEQVFVYVFDYEQKKNVKALQSTFFIEKAEKISNNLIAFSDNRITKDTNRFIVLFDFIKYQFIKKIDIFKPHDGDIHDVKVMSLIFKNILLVAYTENGNTFIKQYKVL